MKIKLFLIGKIVCAIILLQTLFFKFSGSAESVYIFSALGMEPWGRIGSGVVELLAGLLLLIPKYDWLGGLLALGTISGAIFFHLTKLGIDVQGDGGYLFVLALVVFGLSLWVVFERRSRIPMLNKLF